MDCLAIPKRINIIKTYYKNVVSTTATYRALRVDYGLYNRPTTQAIAKILKRRVVIYIERLVHNRFPRSIENIAIVSESVAEDTNLLIPRRP